MLLPVIMFNFILNLCFYLRAVSAASAQGDRAKKGRSMGERCKGRASISSVNAQMLLFIVMISILFDNAQFKLLDIFQIRISMV